MEYKAKKVYQNEDVVSKYDEERFRSLKGRLVNKRELHLINKALCYAKITHKARILDIPCGTGRLSFFLAEKGYQVTGVDISPAMIKQCEIKLIESNIKQKVEFKIGDAEDLSFPDDFFDVVVSLRLFGHLPPQIRQNVLKELKRVSKSFLIVVYYHKNSLQGLFRKKMRTTKEIAWHSLSLNQIDEELKNAGLKRVARFFMLPSISETVVILAKKLQNEMLNKVESSV